MVLGRLASWKKYLDVAYPIKPADWDAELARIEAKLSEPGRMKVLQAMCKTSPTDAGAQLANVTCPVLVIEGSLDPDWADPRAEGEKIIADLPTGLGELAVIDGAGHYPHAQTPDEVLALARPFLAKTLARMPRAGLPPAVGHRGRRRPGRRDRLRPNLSMGLLAERLGVKTPALYKHVTSQADLAHRIAVLAMAEFADAIRDAIQGRAGSDALAAGAQAMRTYVREHPGRYAAADAAARPTGPDDPIIPAVERVVASWAAMLRGYHLDSGQEIHALRMLRSVLHGFATLEAAGGFQIDAACRRQLHLDGRFSRPRPARHPYGQRPRQLTDRRRRRPDHLIPEDRHQHHPRHPRSPRRHHPAATDGEHRRRAQDTRIERHASWADYGRIGNSGVSIATLDDMKKLYSGFDLCAPTTSVSMTINGPAPMILAMFMNTAIDQRVEKHLRATGQWEAAEKKIAALFKDRPRPAYKGELPPNHDGSGLGLLGVTGDQLLDAGTYQQIRMETLSLVRGTVQADILKEEQAQNTCIFSTEFALRMMGDVQQFFIDNDVRNFYSVSISGYHIAEAGANPVSQLAFTLANGFTIAEYYLARGMKIDDFAPNLSFFFSNGMDPEYAVIGRVARRIWARAMRDLYRAGPRSQMLKYHIQTSGRSLHAQEIQFNDVRTTLQALYALFDNCNSLHTNAYDEAITTPTEESVRRAVAIQLIIGKELGLNKTQNPWQGSFAIDQLTDLVEEAVYREFDRISERGGVLGAMETMYQRGKIQEESLYYETLKHDGTLPIIGVNTYLAKAGSDDEIRNAELIRSTDEEKRDQVAAVRAFLARNAEQRPAAFARLQRQAATGGNVFAELMEAVKVASLGSISAALYQVGGQYRRSM